MESLIKKIFLNSVLLATLSCICLAGSMWLYFNTLNNLNETLEKRDEYIELVKTTDDVTKLRDTSLLLLQRSKEFPEHVISNIKSAGLIFGGFTAFSLMLVVGVLRLRKIISNKRIQSDQQPATPPADR